jgi:hypothetical protein
MAGLAAHRLEEPVEGEAEVRGDVAAPPRPAIVQVAEDAGADGQQRFLAGGASLPGSS